jgi:hypothetical protein
MRKLRRLLNRHAGKVLAGAAVAVSSVSTHAAAADPADVVATGTTVFESASVLAVALLSFTVVFRIVKRFAK